MISRTMAKTLEHLVGASFLMLKTLQGKRRRYSSFRRRQISNGMIARQYRLRRMHSRLSREQIMCFKMFTSWVKANTFRRNKTEKPNCWWEKTVQKKFSDHEWHKYFRMNRVTFRNLVNEISSYLSSSSILETHLAADKEVAIALLSMAHGKRPASVAHLFGVRRFRVVSAIRRVCDALVKVIMPRVIKVPAGDVLDQYLQKFEHIWNFPQCAGVLGSIHVPLNTSNLPENSSDYINSTSGHSMILQGVVGPSYEFWDVNVGWPGSVTESRIFNSSALWARGQDGKLFPDKLRNIRGVNAPILILAGSSYPLADWVLKPFPQTKALPDSELKFNEKFEFAHCTSDIAFTRLKARWNCLVIGNICNIDIFPNVAAACCVLHNLCENAKEPVLDRWVLKAERSYQQPLPSACNSVIGLQAEKIQNAFKDFFHEQ